MTNGKPNKGRKHTTPPNHSRGAVNKGRNKSSDKSHASDGDADTSSEAQEKTKENAPKCCSGEPKDKKWTTMEWITLWGVIVNGFLFLGTVAYVIISGIALNESRRFNDTSIEAQKAGFDLQLANIKEAQKEFELSNRPFVQIQKESIKIIRLVPNEPPQVSFGIINSGKFPAEVVVTNYYTRWAAYKDYFRIDTGLYRTISTEEIGAPVDQVISSGYVLAGGAVSGYKLSNDDYNQIKSGAMNIYLVGLIKYKNLMTGKYYINKFAYKIGEIPAYNIVIMRQQDIPL